jgi:energy-coupling factor transport system substrate-specific component
MFFILFETINLDAKYMAIISMLSALGGVSRVAFAAAPGLKPTTFITAVSGYILGPTGGFIVGAMSAFISNFFLGHGPWTLWQMLGWGLCGFFFGLIKVMHKKIGMVTFSLLCFIWGYIYGIILDMWYVVAFIKPLNLQAVISGVVMSFYFDTAHAFGNLAFSLAFAKKFITVLERFNKRFTVKYIE